MCDREHYDGLEKRVTELERAVEEMRGETQRGIAAVNANIETLSQQMANMDRRMVEEKAKWGDVFRGIVKASVRVLLGIAVFSVGMNLTKGIVTVLTGGM